MAILLQSFQDMAQANKDLVAEVKAGREEANSNVATAAATGAAERTATTELPGAVAITGIKVPLDMGRDAEERLINFHEWKEDVADRMTVAGIMNEQRKTTIALMWGGRDLKDFAVDKAKVVLTENGDTPADNWTSAATKIEETMEGEINEAFAMFKFRQSAQENQSIDTWYKRLRSAVKTLRLQKCTCGHGYSEERAIRDIMVEMTNDSKLRKEALSKDLPLAALLKEGEANELARKRAATVEGKKVMQLSMNEDADLTEAEAQFMIAKLKRAGRYSTRADKRRENEQPEPCPRCTNPKQPHHQDRCYFVDKKCRNCNQIGHMGGSKMCPKTEKKVKKVSVEKDYDDPQNWEERTVVESGDKESGAVRAVGKKNVVTVTVGDEETEMYADSGADVSIVPQKWYRKSMGRLQATNLRLSGYGSAVPLTVAARFRAEITTQKGAHTSAWVYVVDSDVDIQPLLGDPEATALGFIEFKPDGREPSFEEQQRQEVQRISEKVSIGQGSMPDDKDIPEITEEEVDECWDIIDDPKYDTIFDGHIGKMVNRKPIVFQADESARIRSQPYRPIPLQHQAEISQHLQFLRDNGKLVNINPNIDRVDTCSNLVISRKPSGQLRMNVDARPINATAADIVTPHMTTPEDVRHKLTGSTRFSEFDMNHGYNQSTLSEGSSKKYGVVQSHEGLHRFKSLYFGHKQSSQAFHEDVEMSFRGTSGTEHVADNLLVHGRTGDEHKKHLRLFLDRCLSEGVTLKREATVCKDSVLWFGYVFGRDGVKPDPSKVQNLRDKGRPENQEEVRSFLQAAQFNAKFMWDTDQAYAHITQPLRNLMGKGVLFRWGEAEQHSYDSIINALESAGALYPLRTDLEICHIADAAPSGIASSVYMVTEANGEETWWPINHTSRSLSKTEISYPQIDRESLAQSWGMTQNRYYLVGREFTTYTDHRPLLPLYNHSKKAAPRIEKHILRVQDLNFHMKFMAGKSNPSDWYSRHPEDIEQWSDLQKEHHNVDSGRELRLNRISAVRKLDKFLHEVGVTADWRVSEEDIRKQGLEDSEYTTTRKLIAEGECERVTGEYKHIAKELTVHGDLLLRDDKFVIPRGKGELRRNLLETAHEGHPGMTQLKTILRGSVYWPGITKDIEHAYKG